MSFVATKWAWEPGKFLEKGEKLVLLCLASFANKDRQCWPSYRTITAKTGMAECEVRENLQSLRELKLITSERGDRRMIYTLIFDDGKSGE